MSEISVIIRTADQTRKAEISLAPESTVAEIVQAAIENWSLPRDTDYSVVNISNGKALNPTDTLQKLNIASGDILEIQPVLVAGIS